MPYIIRNEATDRYMVYNMKDSLNISWTSSQESASTFRTLGSAQNFILHNYKPHARKTQLEENVKVIELYPLAHTDPVCLPTAAMELNTKTEADLCLRSMPSPGMLEQRILAMKSYYVKMRTLAEEERNDILHKIELDEKLNAAERAVLFKRLKEILQWRRQVKDMAELIETYETSGFLAACRSLERKHSELYERLQTRQYAPRILSDLFSEIA